MTLSLAEKKIETHEEPTLTPEETVRRIREGENSLRSPFIAQYRPFISAATSRLINAPSQGRDEFSVALDAFNEAIDRFDAEKHRSFLSWSDLVINHRVIDYLRSNRRHERAYPFTYYEASGNEELIERSVREDPSLLSDHLEIKEEIEAFKERLAAFGIKLSDLVECAPKHVDSRVMCAMLARRLSESEDMKEKLERTGQLPVAALLESARVGRKAVENNRKYIIAIYVILTSGMEIIKGYIDFMQEGVSGK